MAIPPGAALCLLLGASGCFTMPPPLMYPQTPVPAGHFAFGGAVAGSAGVPGTPGTSAPSPFPGLQLAARYGLGDGASLGLSVSGGPTGMLDGRLEVFRTPHLSLSLGAEVGVVGLPMGQPKFACTNPCPIARTTPPFTFGLVTDVPWVLGLQAGRSTIWLGFRPGFRLGLDPGSAGGDPVVGGLVGLSIPIHHVGAVALQLDVTHSLGYRSTVVTAAVGLTR